MARRKKKAPTPHESEDDPDRELTPQERAQEDHVIECLWRMAAWHSGFGRAVCDRAACRRARACAGPRKPPPKGDRWAGQPPVCVTWETHVPIRDFLHAWVKSLPPDTRVVSAATFRTPTHPGGPTPLDPQEARARLSQWLSDGTLTRRPCP